ncbi:hypothetical protein [Bradyrhizobium sp. SZCCHNR1045]|uniref:hypothetical protein n=1 Tax=Bradyrhizobium sp. SZCCHNR1045 TaxID=3057353 RepID=UPI002916F2DD|nr:hypothetical protein [Bradyrhizobium sp. SZCCHNR1045]
MQAIEAQAAAEAAQAELAQLKAKHEAAFEERAAELFQRHQATEELEQSIDLDKQTVLRVLSEIRTIDMQLKHAAMNYGGILEGFNARLADLPDWESLNRDLLGKYDRDPHFGKQKSENGRDDLEEYATETGPVPDAMPDATITRSHRMMSRVS